VRLLLLLLALRHTHRPCLPQVFMLPSDRRLDEATLQDILVQGHSRLPVHAPGDRCVCAVRGTVLLSHSKLVACGADRLHATAAHHHTTHGHTR
jgi:hypothetical protein